MAFANQGITQFDVTSSKSYLLFCSHRVSPNFGLYSFPILLAVGVCVSLDGQLLTEMVYPLSPILVVTGLTVE